MAATNLVLRLVCQKLPVRSAINGFALGAKHANPNAKVQLVWANSWYDVDIETQC